jgi:hypothetical protein
VETLDTVVAVCFAERFAPYFRRKIGAIRPTPFRVISAQEKCNGQSKTWNEAPRAPQKIFAPHEGLFPH